MAEPTRRRPWLKWLGGAVATALGLALVVPATVLLTFPARKKREEEGFLDVGPLERLPDGVPLRVPVIAKRRLDAWTAFTDVTLGAAWLVRRGGEVRAFSTVCPHAGCSVDWHEKRFECPCHGSVFAADGAVLDGPSPRPLDPLDVEVKEGRVRVAYRRFRQGVRDQEPA
jgi:Rieske Fe-S protein